MTYEESAETRMLRETVRRFVDKEMPRELARECDKNATFPRDVYDKLCRLGVTGLTVPEEHGGTGVDVLSAIVVIEELSRRGTFLSGPYIHCAFYGSMNIGEHGSERQKNELLPRLARGELFFAYALSEPDVGGDLASAQVSGVVDRGQGTMTISGTKRWCTGARFAHYLYTLVRSGPPDARYHNLSLVLVPSDAAGISITDIDHMGMRYTETTDVAFDDVVVPLEDVVGGPDAVDQGWPMLVGRALDVEKLEVSAVALGIAAAAVADAWDYAQEREQFGRKISGHQAVRHTLVDVRTKLEACRHMLYHAAALATAGRDCSVESSMAKLFVAETAMEIVLACQGVMGAYGYAREYDMERYVRDIVAFPMVGGSSNMQRNNLANRLGLASR